MNIKKRRALLVPAVAGLALTLAACGGGSGFADDDATTAGASGSATSNLTDDASHTVTVMIGSSGDAETAAVKDAVAKWSTDSGVKAEVTVASDLSQQLSQGFASGNPADVFYLQSDYLAGYASNGSLLAYGDQLKNKDDFYPSLVSNFTYDGQFYCAPKDFSTLALIINTDMWKEAGLTDADYPTTWEELETVAKKLTTADHVGLSFSAEYARLGAFMAQAGGTLMNEDQTEATANSEANVTALNEVKKLLASGDAKYAKDLGAGWGGEAFGKGLAAMVIEGNWITGSMSADYPDVNYKVVELPAGPSGKGTMQFTNCWGVAADSPSQTQALDLVEYLTSTDQQLAFSTAFGVMPSIQSAASEWESENPDLVPFLKGADYAVSVPTLSGASDVVADFNSQLEGLATGDPQKILDSVQTNLEALLK
ncbi:MAG: ABC transporter substrate-binding protein [Ancrocorticia sp.]|jgi:multiple sugar transport system substrate-binding protein|nr:ABC transporter substrate-binding protein [Ancrocorticia sp.]MCI2003006.1 ABC transporter substrate-binding protein [Ancrocorticia sp.]MCI2179304.1 ABC transporter substrate-binding protein [Ancrocorticia sp.]MCI2193677.1 ABC transporter substrate-binding protein [Ancrocorticia sp.]